MSPRPARSGRRRRRLLVAGGLVLAVVAAAVAGLALRRPGDVSDPGVSFRTETVPPAPAPAPPPSPRARARAEPPHERFVWPIYGYTKDRRRYLPGPSLRPPYARLWSVRARALLEFSPVIGPRWLYLLDDDGFLWSIRKKTGDVRWKKRVGVLAAASPAYHRGRLYVVVLERGRGRPGRVLSLRARDGKILWDRNLPSRAESSPLVDRGRVYFGSEDGTVYALRASDGATRWTFRAQGAVKGALALADGRLHVGDYAGAVYAIRQRDGRLLWRTRTRGAGFGLRAGQFYSTPAVAFGRVYLGNTDGNVYSFAADSGRLAWRTRTGGYVYGSPAVAHVPGGRPAVYVGSYDGRFYALHARSGKRLWTYDSGGTISGGATVIGDIVYFSNNRLKTTTGLGARTGRRVFRFYSGAFNPVVSDGERLFVAGSSTLYALRPRRGG